MLRRQLILGTLVVVVTTLLHVASLVAMAGGLKWLAGIAPFESAVLKLCFELGVVVLCIIAVHVLEAWIWAALYQYLGEFDDVASALYFSVVTCTTLGYGDLTLSARWRLLASLQAIGGLILFGASTAFFLRVMEALFAVR